MSATPASRRSAMVLVLLLVSAGVAWLVWPRSSAPGRYELSASRRGDVFEDTQLEIRSGQVTEAAIRLQR